MKKQVAYLQKLFYDLWNDFGSVYLVVDHSDRTRIGNRGFTVEEKQHGLVLVFNNKTSAELHWDGEGNLSCVLAFGSQKENVYIDHHDLRGVFSPVAGVQFLRTDTGTEEENSVPQPMAGRSEKQSAGAMQVVSLGDFRKQKTREKQ